MRWTGVDRSTPLFWRFFLRFRGGVAFGARLASLQATENEANFLLRFGKKIKVFSFKGFCHWLPDRGLPLGPPLLDPHYWLALHARHVSPPHIFDLVTPPFETAETVRWDHIGRIANATTAQILTQANNSKSAYSNPNNLPIVMQRHIPVTLI